MGAGTVVGTRTVGQWGNALLIRHNLPTGMVYSLYAHMVSGSLKVEYLAEVTAGQPIGRVDCTGTCIGSHLHFAVKRTTGFGCGYMNAVTARECRRCSNGAACGGRESCKKCITQAGCKRCSNNVDRVCATDVDCGAASCTIDLGSCITIDRLADHEPPIQFVADRLGQTAMCGNGGLYFGNHPILIYDVLADSWTAGPQIPEPRHFPAVAAGAGKIYVAGGERDSDGTLSTRVDVYNPTTNEWEGPVSPMTDARSRAAAVVVNDVIYVMGGRVSNGSASTTVQAYNVSSNTWTQKASIPRGHDWSVAGVISGKIYLVGGFYNNIDLSSMADEYDPVSNHWTSAPEPFKTPPNVAHYGGAGGVINGRFYIAGGQTTGLGFTNVTEEGSPP